MGLATAALLQKREQLVHERSFFLDRINAEISELETAIEQLAGKKVWEVEKEVVYDDTNPDYIKSSQEEI